MQSMQNIVKSCHFYFNNSIQLGRFNLSTIYLPIFHLLCLTPHPYLSGNFVSMSNWINQGHIICYWRVVFHYQGVQRASLPRRKSHLHKNSRPNKSININAIARSKNNKNINSIKTSSTVIMSNILYICGEYEIVWIAGNLLP